MTILNELLAQQRWERFFAYKESLAGGADPALREWITDGGYLEPAAAILRGEPFPLPRKSVINKLHSEKKRVVYTYPPDENNVLKLLTYLLLRKYDGIFAPNLYSFRPGRTAKDAIRYLCSRPEIRKMYAYKADISNYFNSIPLPQLLQLLEETLNDDPELIGFLRGLLEEPRVLDGGKIVTEEKGIMAGTPVSAFLANLYLSDLDRQFAAQKIPYARYSDDIILFAPTAELRDRYAAEVRVFLAKKGLICNPAKEKYSAPEDGWCFLGFSYRSGVIDIAPSSVTKLKHKMRRKTRALHRWQKRHQRTGEQAAAAFIRIFNRKLLEQSPDSDLTWCCWYFSVINTAESLREIDRYAQDCLRFLISGKRTKARYNVRYEQLKALGYRSLVHAYYDFSKEEGGCRKGCAAVPRSEERKVKNGK